jgi:2-C-methyl-D-erythritol 2,4-cyclodiphosphate synthase
MSMRIGLGWDSHAFKPGVPLKIGGLAIDHPEGLAGHSDGDVLLHAITDALLGAVSAGDIGSFFPPGDPRWKNADSSIFLNLAREEIQNAGYRIVNVDTTLVLAAPKIGPIASDLRDRVAELLDLKPSDVGIKAKTPEGLNADHVAQAHAVVLLEKVEDPLELLSKSDVAEMQRQLEDFRSAGRLSTQKTSRRRSPHGQPLRAATSAGRGTTLKFDR